MAETRFAFFKGEIVPIAQAQVSVMTHALNYGTGAFAGMRAYWNEDEAQQFIFRSYDHFRRLLQSASLLRMSIPYNEAQLTQILVDLLREEGFREHVYIRPLVYKSHEGIGVRLHDIDDDLTIFALPFGDYVKRDGIHACFSAWRRVDDNAIPARGKITGAYANSALIKSDAILAGYDEALVLNNDGHISEASSANVFIVRDGVAYTPPYNANVLEGIVRRSIITLLQNEMGVDVVERNIDRTEVYLAEEAFVCGTAVEFAPITRVEHRPVGSGDIGPIARELGPLVRSVVTGRVEKYREWLTPVYTGERV